MLSLCYSVINHNFNILMNTMGQVSSTSSPVKSSSLASSQSCPKIPGPEKSERSGQFSRFLAQFQDICTIFKAGLTQANQTGQSNNQKQVVIGEGVLEKLDTLIALNTRINQNLKRVTLDGMKQSSPLSLKKTVHSLTSIQTETSTYITQDKLQKNDFYRTATDTPGRQVEIKNERLQSIVQEFTLPIDSITQMLGASIPDLFAAHSVRQHTVYESEKVDGQCQSVLDQVTKEIGKVYIQDAEFYFKQYSSARLNYDDMKIKFSQNMMYRMIAQSAKWLDYYNQCIEDGKLMRNGPHTILSVFDNTAKQTLSFLIHKYPPSRRKIIDTELNQKIKEKRSCSAAKYDILKNSNIGIGMNQSQTDFTKDIKVFLNLLTKETLKEFPLFKQTMKAIFSNQEGSMDGFKGGSDVQYTICTKISQNAEMYSESDMDSPGLEIRSPQILRILMKWCEELFEYFQNTHQAIVGNKFGFKNMKSEGIPIKIPHSKKVKLAENIKRIYQTELKQTLQLLNKQTNILVFNVIKLCLGGIQGFAFLNEKELTVLKLTECLSQILRSSVITCLNILLKGLTKVPSLYSVEEVESNIHLVTFGIKDLLRCRCVGTKNEIYRIYNQIASKTDYFEIIRIKNKLNEPTRDILINLKLKNSFLICEVQLSLGDQVEEVNDHFCHYLYELSRGCFGPLFGCANQVWSLDPRIGFIKKNPQMKFKVDPIVRQQFMSNLRSADFLYCSNGHQQVAMKLQQSTRPYCCNTCSTFHSAYKSWLVHIQCPKCYNVVCFNCFNDLKKKNQCLMHNYLKDDEQINKMGGYCFTDAYYSSIADPDKMIRQITKLFRRYEYIVYIVINNRGKSLSVKKRYKKSFTKAFSTVKEIPQVSICAKQPYHWNAIFPLKNPVVKLISELKKFRKVHITHKWYEIEEMLEKRGISEVICIIDQQTRSALVIDIVETEKQIQEYEIQRSIDKSVAEYNKSHCGHLEMTSKMLTDITFLKNINEKQSLRTLNLWQNNIKDIAVLEEFNNLQELYLKQNQIESIEPILGMRSLTIIGLTSNRIKGQLPTLNFPHLQVMDISQVELNSIDNLVHSSLNSLMMLKINGSNIIQVPKLDLPSLTMLNIGNGKIHNIDEFCQSSLPQLKRLALHNNFIRGTVPKMQFPRLEILQLQNNQISDISEFVRVKSPNLLSLNFSHNAIEGTLDYLDFPSLVSLDISNNKISKLSSCLFQVPERFNKLQKLNLSFNEIGGELEQIKLNNLRELDLRNNLLSSIGKLSTSQLPQIQEINVSCNFIDSDFPLLRFSHLRSLDAQNNSICCIDDLSLSKLPQLYSLNLSNNKIESLPQLQLQSLKMLDVSDNSITKQCLVQCLHLLPRVVEINLKGNSTQLEKEIYKKKRSIQLFKFE